MSGQFLSAVFELRPTRRKAATLERVRAAAERVFWSVLATERPPAEAIAAIEEAKTRRDAWRAAGAARMRTLVTAALREQLPEPVVQGLSRDLDMAISSYIGLRAGGHAAEWPSPVVLAGTAHADALAALTTATTKGHEDAARDALAMVEHHPGPRPLTIARARDARLVRTGATGAIAVVINILRASDPRAETATLAPGIDASTGEEVRGGTSKTRLIVPIVCSKWHEQKFLAGGAILRSSLLRRDGDRWFMCAQFEFPERKVVMTGARLGVDRGIVNPIAAAVTRRDGSVCAVMPPDGGEIGRIIHRADKRRASELKRRGTTSHHHVDVVNNQLHLLANRIVSDAKQYGAAVVTEKLDGFKQTIVAKRASGARKGGWRRSLKRVQLGKLEVILNYKLKMAGLPPLRDVVAGGTSITCPACAQRDGKNRPAQDRFECVACGFVAHADTIGAVNIARRGIAMEKIKKGDKLAPLEQNMVAGLRSRDDSGLGPMMPGYAYGVSGLVAARAAAVSAHDPTLGRTGAAGQNGYPHTQNAGNRVFAERRVRFSGSKTAKSGFVSSA